MNHALKNRKQSEEHIRNRVRSLKESLKLKPRKLSDMETKFLKKIEKTDTCWNWKGSIFRKPYGNYGQMRVGRKGEDKLIGAHRIAYEIYIGTIPSNLEVDHLCHNTLCVNPKHLEAVTHAENIRRRKDSGLLSCRHGHKYSPATTYIRPDNGRRECKICRKIRMSKYICYQS